MYNSNQRRARNFIGLVPGFARQTQPVTAVPGLLWTYTTQSVQAIATP